MSKSPLVREAGSGDGEAVVSIIEGTENLSPDEKECAVELLDIYLDDLEDDKEDGEYLLLVAEIEDDRLAGYICYGPASFADGVSEIYWVVVGDSFKGRGVATALVEHVENVLKKTGLRMLVAETSGTEHYEAARSFYKNVGFIEEARIEGFFKADDDKTGLRNGTTG